MKRLFSSLIKWQRIFCMLFFLIGLVGCVQPPARMGSTPIPTPPLGSHRVVSSSIPLVEIWRYRVGYSEAFDLQFNPPPLVIARDKVIISAYVDANDPYTDSILTARALDSGEILWQTRYSKINRYGATRINFHYFDEKLNRLYLQYGFNIGAFDTETGKQIWVTPSLGDHTTYIFAQEQQDGFLTVKTNNNELLTFDPSDGRLLSIEKVTYYLTIARTGTEIPIPRTIEFKWAFECARPKIWPTFVGNDDLLLECAWRDSAWPYMLYRANYKTGQTIWSSPRQFISNYALRGNTLYIVDESAKLQAINIETGELLGMMAFDGEMTDTAHIRPFWAAIQDPYLFIYFGDTQELVAFKFEPQ